MFNSKKKVKLDNSSLLENFELKEHEREITQTKLYHQLTKVRIEKNQKYMKEKHHPPQPINNANEETVARPIKSAAVL